MPWPGCLYRWWRAGQAWPGSGYVVVDGTKTEANASKRKAMSWRCRSLPGRSKRDGDGHHC